MHRLNMPTLCSFLVAVAIVDGSCDGRQNGLVDEKYKGRPLAVINGSISIDAPEAIDAPISIAVAWLSADDLSYYNDSFYNDYDEYYDDTAAETTVVPGDVKDGDSVEESDYEAYYDNMCPPPLQGTSDLSAESCNGTIGAPYTETCRSVNDNFWSMQASEYKAESLLKFTLPIYELPPSQARTDLTVIGGKGWFAEGIIVAFTDKNGNGRFDMGTPEKKRDQVISSTYLDTGDEYYLGWVVYFDGAIPKGSQVNGRYNVTLKQGINLIVEEEPGMRFLSPDEPIALVPVDVKRTGAEFVALQCAEAEYVIENNVSPPEEGVDDCASIGKEMSQSGISVDGDTEMTIDAGVADADEPLHIERYTEIIWWTEFVKPDNPCVVYVKRASVCMTGDAELPEGWDNICGGFYL